MVVATPTRQVVSAKTARQMAGNPARSTLARWIRDGAFPPPMWLGGKRVWDLKTLQDFFNAGCKLQPANKGDEAVKDLTSNGYTWFRMFIREACEERAYAIHGLVSALRCASGHRVTLPEAYMLCDGKVGRETLEAVVSDLIRAEVLLLDDRDGQPAYKLNGPTAVLDEALTMLQCRFPAVLEGTPALPACVDHTDPRYYNFRPARAFIHPQTTTSPPQTGERGGV